MPEEQQALTRSYPVQLQWHRPSESGQVNESLHMAAYEVYSSIFKSQPAMTEGSCRWGFGAGELIALLYARTIPKAEWRVRFEQALVGMRNL